MKIKTLKKKKDKKKLVRWKLPKKPKVSTSQTLRPALHEIIMNLIGTSKQEKDSKPKPKDTNAKKEQVKVAEKEIEEEKRAYNANTHDSSSNPKYKSNQQQTEKQIPETRPKQMYQNDSARTVHYAAEQGKEIAPYKPNTESRESHDVASRWEAYARAHKDEKGYDRMPNGNFRQTENRLANLAETQRTAYEEKTTLESAANDASRHYENKGAEGLETKTEIQPIATNQETLHQKVEQNVPKIQLSMEQQMFQLERYENNAVNVLKTYQSGKIDAQSASVIDSLKLQIGYKGSCCDTKLVSALVEYQEKNKVELGGKI